MRCFELGANAGRMIEGGLGDGAIVVGLGVGGSKVFGFGEKSGGIFEVPLIDGEAAGGLEERKACRELREPGLIVSPRLRCSRPATRCRRRRRGTLYQSRPQGQEVCAQVGARRALDHVE